MTENEYKNFALRYKGCGACFPMYHTLSRFEKMWFTAIQKDVADLEKENAELKEELNYAETHCLFHSDCPTQKELASIKLKVEALSEDVPWNELKDKSEVVGKLTKAKDLIELLLSDNRIMKAQFESEEQANIWFEHIHQAEQFISEVEK